MQSCLHQVAGASLCFSGCATALQRAVVAQTRTVKRFPIVDNPRFQGSSVPSFAQVLKRPVTYAVIPADSNFNFTNLDRWYERDAGELKARLQVQSPTSNVQCPLLPNQSARHANDNSVLRLCRRTVRKGSAFPQLDFYLFHEASPHESEAQPPVIFGELTVRQSLTARAAAEPHWFIDSRIERPSLTAGCGGRNR